MKCLFKFLLTISPQQSYTSILYLRLPPGFRIILRGKDVEHHNLVNDLMFTQEHTYKPHGGIDNVQKESNVSFHTAYFSYVL